MFAFIEFIQDLFKQLSNQHVLIQLILIALVVNGLFFVTCVTLFSAYKIFQVIRLYLIAQCSCVKVDYVKRYGRWAVVTGATDGIGLAMAKELARRGHSIIIVGRNESKLGNCKDLIEAENNGKQIEVLTVKMDLSDASEENYAKARDQIEPDKREIGILINNAGVASSETKLFHEFEEKLFLQIASVNMLAMLHFTSMILPGMIFRGRGCVINVSSVLGRVPSPFSNIYGPSKAFVNEFTSNMRIEYHDFPVDFISITPSSVQTNMLHQLAGSRLMKKESFIAPSAENFARGIINAISTRISPFTGCLGHAISFAFLKMFHIAGLYLILIKFVLRVRVTEYKPHGKPQESPEINIQLNE